MIRLEIHADAVPVAERLFRSYPATLREFLRRAMVNSTVEVMFRLKSNVHVVTGTLRRSWQPKPVTQGPDGIGFQGGTGTTLAYAAAEEFGKTKPETVRAHTRRVKSRDVTTREKLFRTGFDESGNETTRTTTRRRLIASGLGRVRAHTRRPNRPAHPYARPALEESRTAIVRLHELAIMAANQRVRTQIEAADRRGRG